MLGHFISFDKLIGTKLIKFLYYLGLLAIVLSGLFALITGFGSMQYGFGTGLWAVIVAIFGTLIGIIFWRFLCEIYMLFFRMSDDLRDIKTTNLALKPTRLMLRLISNF